MEQSNPHEITKRPVRHAVVAGAAAVGLLLLSGCGPTEQAPRPAPISVSPSETQAPKGEFSTEPSWVQDFSTMPDGRPDSQVWHYELDPAVPGWNHEAQGYTNHLSNVRIQNGSLVLEAHRETYRYPHDPEHKTYKITSGRIDTRDSFTLEYGKIEATMKIPKGRGTWPAFWLLSANEPNEANISQNDPRRENDRFYLLTGGELDIMEAYSGTDIEGTFNSFKDSPSKTVAVPHATSTFHTYGLEVTPDAITWTVDGKPYFQKKKTSTDPAEWPYGKGNQMYVVLNLAMGGSGAGRIDPHMDNWQLDVKDLKFFSYNDK